MQEIHTLRELALAQRAGAEIAGWADVEAVLFAGDGNGTGEGDPKLAVLGMLAGLCAGALEEPAVAIGHASSRNEVFITLLVGALRNEPLADVRRKLFRGGRRLDDKYSVWIACFC